MEVTNDFARVIDLRPRVKDSSQLAQTTVQLASVQTTITNNCVYRTCIKETSNILDFARNLWR